MDAHGSRLLGDGSFGPQGGRGVLYFISIRRLGPSIYCSPQKYQEFQAPPKKKNICNFINPPKYLPFCNLPLIKDPKMHRNGPKYRPILWWPQINIHKIFISQKIFIFLKTPKNIEIKSFEPQKLTRAYVCIKISEYPPPLGFGHPVKTDGFESFSNIIHIVWSVRYLKSKWLYWNWWMG